MNFFKFKLFSLILIYSNLYAQYDAGTQIYSQTSGTNLISVLKNYVVVDFDGDNYSDILMVKANAANNTHQLTWYKGDGIGSFTPQSNILNINNGQQENEIFYEDMNEDGIEDIVYQNSYNGFTVLLNDGQGNISVQVDNEVMMDTPIGADLKELADLDGDGDIDGIFWANTDSMFLFQRLGHCLIGYNNGMGTSVKVDIDSCN